MHTTPRTHPSRPSFYSIVVVALCAALIVLVVVLARQNGRLKAELAEALASDRRATTQSAQATLLGQRLAAVVGIDAAGHESPIPLDSPGRRLVMIASVQCTTCQDIRPYWREAAQWARSAEVQAVCLLTDERPSTLDSETLGVPVYQVKNFNESSIGNLPLVPALLLLRDGVVERVWLGEPQAAQRDEVLAALQRR